jgi:thiol-disulfide isomerase/thioredoxin
LQEATAEKKFVMVDFYTGWCHWCKVLDRDTYSDSSVIEFANDRFVSVKVNADKVPALAQKYGVRGYPTILFLHPDGSVKKVVRGFQPAKSFLPAMQKVTNSKAQCFTLSNRIADDPTNPDLRRIYTQVLALSGDYQGAVAQSDTLLQLDGESGVRADLELDLLTFRMRVGQEDLATSDWTNWQQALAAWRKRHSEHDRIPEAVLLAARGAEAAGQAKEARSQYRQVVKAHPGTWYSEFARVRLESLDS